MTKPTKPVTRSTANRVGRHEVVITIAPCGHQPETLVGVRLKGKRTQYVVALSDVFRWAAQTFAAKEKAAKKAARQQGVPWRKARKEFLTSNSI